MEEEEEKIVIFKYKKDEMTTRNRGKDTGDDSLFGSEKMVLKLRNAAQDMNYLLSRGFAEKASAELVGNRYKLRSRQIQMLKGASASDFQMENRKNKLISTENLENKTVYLDGFNVLILLESLLSNAYVFKGWDDCYRDLSSVHGSYKRVLQTQESIELVAKFFKNLKLEKIIWVFDKPVSNSGRIKQMILDLAQENKWNWEVILEFNPDRYIVEHSEIAVSSDGWILDECKLWFNILEYLITQENLNVNLIETKKND